MEGREGGARILSYHLSLAPIETSPTTTTSASASIPVGCNEERSVLIGLNKGEAQRMDVDCLAEQLCSSPVVEQSPAWEQIWQNRTRGSQQQLLRQLVGVLTQKHGEEGLRVANLWLQALADEHYKWQGDIGQLCLILALGSLSEVPATLLTIFLADIARTLMTRWVQQALLIMEKLFGHSDLHASDFRLTRLIDDIHLLPLQLVLPALLDMEQKKAHGYLSEETERSYEDLLTALSVDISPTVLWIAFGENREINLQLVSSGLDQVAASLDLGRIERLLLSTEELETVRIGAARLCVAGKQRAVGSLIAVFQDIRNARPLREAALEALGAIGTDEIIPVLLAALHDTDGLIRYTAMRVMGVVNAPIPVASIIAIVRTHMLPLHFIRNWQPRYTPRDLEAAYRGLSDEQVSVRTFSAALLGRCGELMPADLLNVAAQDQNEEVRREAILALGNLAERMPWETMLAAIQDRDRFVSESAFEAMARSGKTLSIEVLTIAFYNEHLCWRVLRLVEERQIALPVEILLQALTHKFPPCHGCNEYAARLLARLGPAAPIAQLLTILRDDDAGGHTGAAMALYLLRKFVAPKLILDLLTRGDPVFGVQNYLRLALAYHEIGISRAAQLALFRESLLDKEVEQDLITTFCSLGEQAPVEELLGMFDNYTIRKRVVRVLSELYEVITPERLKNAFQYESMQEDIVRRVLERQHQSEHKQTEWYDWVRPEEVQRMLAQVKTDEAVARQVLKAWHEPVPLFYAKLQIDQHVSPFEGEWTEEQVFQQLEASDDRTRFKAFYDLYRLAWQQPAWVFARTRGDERLPVREIMLFALSRLGKDAPIEVALNAVLDKDPRIRAVAAYTLQALDVPDERLPLIGILRLLSDATPLQVSSPRVGVHSLSYRDGFFHTLEQLGGTRYILLQLLSKSRAKALVDILPPLLGDSHPSIREAAAQALYATHPDFFLSVIVPQMEAILRGEPASGPFRSLGLTRIAQVVGGIGRATPAVIALLIEQLAWPYWEVRQQAVIALGKLAGQQDLPDLVMQRLRELLHDPQTKVVGQAASEALAEILSRA